MNLKDVKAITIPEGSVKKILINGITVWEEASAKVLTSITLSGQTTSLNRGAAFSFGGTVTAHYSDSSTADVTSSTTFSGYNMSKAGTYTVTASYTEDGVTVTATYQLTVNKAWSQIWSGTKTVKASSSGTSGASSNFASTVNGTGKQPRIRITYSKLAAYPTSYGTGKYYKNSNTATTTKPSSPVDITVANTNNLYVLGSMTTKTNGQYTYGCRVDMKSVQDTSNNRLRFSLEGYVNSAGAEGECTMTITKIEQYY